MSHLFHPDIPYLASPHFSNRGGKTVEGTVIHYTAGGSMRGTVAWFENQASKVSAHFVGSRSGKWIQTVPLEKAAWHAGASKMLYRGDIANGANRFTIGIELCNYGLLHRDNSGRFWYELAGTMRPYRKEGEPVQATLQFINGPSVVGWWEPYTDAQIDALDWLLKELQKAGYKNAVANLMGHEEIAVPFGTRKKDPGPLFPWVRFGRGTGRKTTQQLGRSDGSSRSGKGSGYASRQEEGKEKGSSEEKREDETRGEQKRGN